MDQRGTISLSANFAENRLTCALALCNRTAWLARALRIVRSGSKLCDVATHHLFSCCLNFGLTADVTGNNYAISNESRTTTARIFFAQGCEVDLSASKDDEQ